jgi:hypothetical protein
MSVFFLLVVRFGGCGSDGCGADEQTSRLMELRFVLCESTFAYFVALQSYLQHHGKPVAFYSGKHYHTKQAGFRPLGV